MITLCAGDLRLGVDPALGASVTRFEREAGGRSVPLFAPGDGPIRGAGDSAMFPMLPFANRARGNRLGMEGWSIAVAPNTPEPLALHGVGWQRRWEVAEQGRDHLSLTLDLCGSYPMDLRLRSEFALAGTGARFTLGIENAGADPVPVGLGFHPYFPRRDDTEIAFAARHLWPEGEGHLPTGKRPVPAAERYLDPRGLPDTWRNQCYSGWDGAAVIRQPSLGYSLSLTAPRLDALMFFAAPGMGRFALEPQSHVSGETVAGPDGLAALAPGARFSASMEVTVTPLSAR